MTVVRLIRVICAALLTAATAAWPHSVPESTVEFEFGANTVAVDLTLPVRELEVGLGRSLSGGGSRLSADATAAVTAYVLARIGVVADDGTPWAIVARMVSMRAESRAPLDLLVRLELRPPAGSRATVTSLVMHYDVIAREVPNHVALVSVRSDWDGGVLATAPKLAGVIRLTNRSVRVERGEEVGWWRGFGGVFRMGLHHIAEGTDHLLFLLALLLPAPLRREGSRWRGYAGARAGSLQILKLVTAFTVGHSVTLAASAFGFGGTGPWVEALIAVSILAAAVHALRPVFGASEAWIAGAFGLVHGLAFAGSISGLGLDRAHTALAVLGFNLGIETMQLGVVICVMPWLLLFAAAGRYRLLRLGGALFAGAAAVGWLGERALGWANPLDRPVQLIASHAPWLVGALALAALVSTGLSRLRMAGPRRAAVS